MQTKTELYWAVGFISGGATTLLTHWNQIAFQFLGWSLILAGISFLCDYFFKSTVLKEYADFILKMQKEGRKIKNAAMPRHSKYYFYFRNLLRKMPWIGYLFSYKNRSQDEVNGIKNKYNKWRDIMEKSTEFIFEKPTKGFPVSVLFREGGLRSDWGRELIHQLQAISVILVNNPLISTSFSEKFEKNPQRLKGFKKKYFQKEKKQKGHWSDV